MEEKALCICFTLSGVINRNGVKERHWLYRDHKHFEGSSPLFCLKFAHFLLLAI
jgi:hypothetical protein